MQLADVNAVLVTGAGSGMGRATAEFMAAEGLNVVCVDVQAEAVTQVANRINGYPIVADVTDAEQISTAIAAVSQEVGPIRVAINCAGIISAGRIVGRNGPMPLENFSHAIQVNLIGTFNVMRVLAAHMSETDPVNADGERGVIINTASVAAFDGQLGQAAYSASKGGVAAMTLPAARELSRFGIRVLAIAPGIIATPMMDGLTEEVQHNLAEQVCFPKRLGQAHEFASLARQIVENAYLNATVLRLDGGIRMQ